MSAPVIVSYGMGVNSSAMLVRMVQLQERIDLVLASDTGDENPKTYAFAQRVSDWLVAHGYPPVTMTRWIRKDGSFESLGDNCLRTRSLPSVAYGLSGCTSKWKGQPLDKFVSEWGPAKEWRASGGRVVRCVGYHAMERRRIDARREKDAADTLNLWRYPLAEFGMDNEDCRDLLESVGLSGAPPSWCRFCPNKLPADILRMREDDPEGLALALAIEDNAVSESPKILGLGRYHFSWRDLLAGHDRQGVLPFAAAAPMPCGCHDGGEE